MNTTKKISIAVIIVLLVLIVVLISIFKPVSDAVPFIEFKLNKNINIFKSDNVKLEVSIGYNRKSNGGYVFDGIVYKDIEAIGIYVCPRYTGVPYEIVGDYSNLGDAYLSALIPAEAFFTDSYRITAKNNRRLFHSVVSIEIPNSIINEKGSNHFRLLLSIIYSHPEKEGFIINSEQVIDLKYGYDCFDRLRIAKQ